MKISLIIKAEGSGAEIIPFLKVGAVMPGALLLTYIFTKLISRFSREQVFYTILVGFLAYFTLFLFVLYPNHKHLRLDLFADYLRMYVFTGEGSTGFIASVRHLNLTVFYVMCEMWSTVVLAMLFWGFANEVTKVDEAKRFYAIFALGANCSGMVSGLFVDQVKKIPYMPGLPFDEMNQWVLYQLFFVLIVGGVIVGIFYWLNRSVFQLENALSLQIPKKSRKISMMECFRFLRTSRYLAYIVVIVIGYNIVYNLSDVMWTNKIAQVYTKSGDVNAYMNQITKVTSFVAVIFAFVVSGNVIRYYGWTIAALITPVIWFFTSIGFFSGLVMEGTIFMDVFANIVSNPANFILLLGSIQYSLGRGCKYTVFDETKEIAFIPLPKEEQRKAKAIVDGLASRFGKSGGSLIYLFLFFMVGNIANTIPYVSIIIFVVILAWIYAIVKIGKIIRRTVDESGIVTSTETAEEVDDLAGVTDDTALAAR